MLIRRHVSFTSSLSAVPSSVTRRVLAPSSAFLPFDCSLAAVPAVYIYECSPHPRASDWIVTPPSPLHRGFGRCTSAALAAATQVSKIAEKVLRVTHLTFLFRQLR